MTDIQTKPNPLRDGDVLIWGAKSIGKVINQSERQVLWMVSEGSLPMVRRVGNRLCAWKSDLLKIGEA